MNDKILSPRTSRSENSSELHDLRAFVVNRILTTWLRLLSKSKTSRSISTSGAARWRRCMIFRSRWRRAKPLVSSARPAAARASPRSRFSGLFLLRRRNHWRRNYFRRPRFTQEERAGDGEDPRPADFHDLSGADDFAQSVAHRRRTDRRMLPRAHGPFEKDRPRIAPSMF